MPFLNERSVSDNFIVKPINYQQHTIASYRRPNNFLFSSAYCGSLIIGLMYELQNVHMVVLLVLLMATFVITALYVYLIFIYFRL